MSTGFIYTISTLNKQYVQKSFSNVPTQYGERIYFGPCKKAMRPKIKPGDYIFGMSPSTVSPRRIVFVGQVEERISFCEAYQRFPELHGPIGPIHVRPIQGTGPFPHCAYEHIPGAMHERDWEADLASPAMDAFFVCHPRNGGIGQWLGKFGPKVENEIFTFLKTCSVHGSAGDLRPTNQDATLQNPIAHGGLFTGLHLETIRPEALVELCKSRLVSSTDRIPQPPIPVRQPLQGGSHAGTRSSHSCR